MVEALGPPHDESPSWSIERASFPAMARGGGKR